VLERFLALSTVRFEYGTAGTVRYGRYGTVRYGYGRFLLRYGTVRVRLAKAGTVEPGVKGPMARTANKNNSTPRMFPDLKAGAAKAFWRVVLKTGSMQ
jgi:hypothetical protein